QPIVDHCQPAFSGLREGMIYQTGQGQGDSSQQVDVRMGRCEGELVGDSHMDPQADSDDKIEDGNLDEADSHSIYPFISKSLISSVNKILHVNSLVNGGEAGS